MNKGDVVGGLIVAGCLAFALRDWMYGERSQSEIDEQMAKQHERLAKKPEKKPLWLKKLEKRWLAAGRAGEAKRRKITTWEARR